MKLNPMDASSGGRSVIWEEKLPSKTFVPAVPPVLPVPAVPTVP